MKTTNFLTAVTLISSMFGIAQASGDANTASFANKTFCQISADSYDRFYFSSNGKFHTENELLSREDAVLKLGSTNWTYDSQNNEITARFSSPSTGSQELKLKVISADTISYKGKILTPGACNK